MALAFWVSERRLGAALIAARTAGLRLAARATTKTVLAMVAADTGLILSWRLLRYASTEAMWAAPVIAAVGYANLA